MTRIETYLLLTWNIIVLNSNHNKHISPQMTDPIRREKIKKRGGGYSKQMDLGNSCHCFNV